MLCNVLVILVAKVVVSCCAKERETCSFGKNASLGAAMLQIRSASEKVLGQRSNPSFSLPFFSTPQPSMAPTSAPTPEPTPVDLFPNWIQEGLYKIKGNVPYEEEFGMSRWEHSKTNKIPGTETLLSRDLNEWEIIRSVDQVFSDIGRGYRLIYRRTNQVLMAAACDPGERDYWCPADKLAKCKFSSTPQLVMKPLLFDYKEYFDGQGEVCNTCCDISDQWFFEPDADGWYRLFIEIRNVPRAYLTLSMTGEYDSVGSLLVVKGSKYGNDDPGAPCKSPMSGVPNATFCAKQTPGSCINQGAFGDVPCKCDCVQSENNLHYFKFEVTRAYGPGTKEPYCDDSGCVDHARRRYDSHSRRRDLW